VFHLIVITPDRTLNLAEQESIFIPTIDEPSEQIILDEPTIVDEPTIITDEFDQDPEKRLQCPVGHPVTYGSQHCSIKTCKYYKKEIR